MLVSKHGLPTDMYGSPATSPQSGHWDKSVKKTEVAITLWQCGGGGVGPSGLGWHSSQGAKGRLSGAIIFEPESKGVSMFVCLCLGGWVCPCVYWDTILGWAGL